MYEALEFVYKNWGHIWVLSLSHSISRSESLQVNFYTIIIKDGPLICIICCACRWRIEWIFYYQKLQRYLLRNSLRDLTGSEIVDFVVGNDNNLLDAVTEGAKDWRNTVGELNLPPGPFKEKDEVAMEYSVKVRCCSVCPVGTCIAAWSDIITRRLDDIFGRALYTVRDLVWSVKYEVLHLTILRTYSGCC